MWLIICVVRLVIFTEKHLRSRCFTLSCLLGILFHLQLIAAQGNDSVKKMKKKAFLYKRNEISQRCSSCSRVYVRFWNILAHLDIYVYSQVVVICSWPIQQMMLHKIRLWRVPATLPYPDFFFTARTLPGFFLKISGFRVVNLHAIFRKW